MPSAAAADVATTSWYHTIELPDGTATPGFVDLRSVRDKVPLPRLDGLRCLDVGSATGYWAFELEKLGAAEVISFDLDDKTEEDWAAGQTDDADWPVGIARRGFDIASEHLGSSVQRVDGSVYDLDPASLGHFDFIFIGSLLLHLRDPVGALMAIRSVSRGHLMSLDVVSPLLTRVFPRWPVYGMWHSEIQQWWLPNRVGHRHMIHTAGFDVLRYGGIVHQRFGAGFAMISARQVRSLKQLRLVAYQQRLGIPSQWVLAQGR